jgi:hypothetical protein
MCIHQVGEQVLTDFQLGFCIALYTGSWKPTALPLDIFWSIIPFSRLLFLLMFSNFYTCCMKLEMYPARKMGSIRPIPLHEYVRQLFSGSMLWGCEIQNLRFLLFRSVGFLKKDFTF